MVHALFWEKLRDPDVADAVEALRVDALRFFVGATAACYALWHTANVVVVTSHGADPEEILKFWALSPFVAWTAAGTWLLLPRTTRGAIAHFLAGAVVSISAAIWLLQAAQPALLSPLVVLVAVVLWNPAAGVATLLGSLALLFGIAATASAPWLTAARLSETAAADALTLVAAWALGRNLVTAVEWSLQSYGQAKQQTRTAREHRAELVKALKQLDHAYYRLERTSAALELAWKAADSAERAKAEFVTSISHELRTPLNLIAGFSELILTAPESYGEPLPPSYRGDLNAIYRSAQHVLTLTNDVIDLARVGAGRLALSREPVDLRAVISEACDIVREYVQAKRLWLRVDVDAGVPTLERDRMRIRQVLLNLLTNAARFTERGGITVSASVGEGEVVVAVRDTGAGIDPADVPRVFDEFHHDGGEAARRSETMGGVGLGLPISKRFVELHGGRMGVESEVGVGTSFWFTLPVGPVEGAPDSEPWKPGTPKGLFSQQRVVALVSGDGQLTQFLQRHLRGARVVAAPTLEGAYALASEHRAAAIIADVAQAGERDDARAPCPVLRVPLPHPERVASSLGATAYLSKPLTRAKLERLIERLPRPPSRVVLVDDDPRFVRLLQRLLRACSASAQCEILTAHTGADALRALEGAAPDLVLLDLIMPGVQGTDVLAEMRRRPDMRSISVAVISGQDQLGGGIPLRGPVTLTKPGGFQLEELLGAIEALLGTLAPPRAVPSEAEAARA